MASAAVGYVGSAIFLLLVCCSPPTAAAAAAGSTFVVRERPVKLREKTSHLRFYFHDVVSGRNATAVRVVPPSKSQPFQFGAVQMMDDLLTAAPERGSPPVGRAQGFYACASQEEMGFLMVMNLAFTAGKYGGSVLSVVGRNAVMAPVREMAVVGGSGLFRFARGYAQAKTVRFDPKNGDATVEYNVYVMHF